MHGICVLTRYFVIKVIPKIIPECSKEHFEGLIDRKSRFHFESSCSSHTNTLRIILTQCAEFRPPYSTQARHSGDTNSYYQSNIVQNTTCCIKVKFQNFRKILSSSEFRQGSNPLVILLHYIIGDVPMLFIRRR